MSSYEVLSGNSDVVLGANIFQKVGSFIKKAAIHSPVGQAIKFIAAPVKQTKAALKTIARFDPTAKTAKYGNITKGVLVGSALIGATILTGGGAAAIAGGAATGLKLGMVPVKKPVRRITPQIDPGVSVANIPPSGNYIVPQGGGYSIPAGSYSIPTGGSTGESGYTVPSRDGGYSVQTGESALTTAGMGGLLQGINPLVILGVVGLSVFFIMKPQVIGTPERYSRRTR